MTADARRLSASLRHLAEYATSVADSDAADEANAVAERVDNARFFVVCVGQFKRGKSTLLDALLGDPVLPAGVTPVTALPTIVRYGERRSTRVRDAGGVWREIPVDALAEYVSEELNPGNQKGITGAEVLEPVSLLANGLCLVDTPGIGSVFEANTRATFAFVPQIDVALVVIGTDPPVSGDELRLIEDAARNSEHMLVVLNKADRSSEQERNEACTFAKRMIEERLGRRIGRIFEVSATDQLNGLGEWPDWKELVAALGRLAIESGPTVSLAAGERALRRITTRLIDAIAGTEWALTAPIEKSEERIERLRGVVTAAERTLDDLAATLTAQEAKLERHFEERSREFLNAVHVDAHARLELRLRSLSDAFGPRLRRNAMAEAQHVAAAITQTWLLQSEQDARQRYEDAMRRFAAAAAEHWRALRASDVEELKSLTDPDDVVAAFVATSQFRFNAQITIAQPSSPLRYAADVLLAGLGLRRIILGDAHRFLDWLLELNVGRVESDMRERMRDGRKALEQALRAAIRSALTYAESALHRVRAVRESGSAGVTAELARLRDVRSKIEKLQGY